MQRCIPEVFLRPFSLSRMLKDLSDSYPTSLSLKSPDTGHSRQATGIQPYVE
jgi:hypothetical protein